MKHYLILIFIVLLKTSLLWGALGWMDTMDIYPPVKVYFKDAKGVSWRIKERLAETLFIVAQAKDDVNIDELLDAKMFYLMQIDLENSSIMWYEAIPKSYFKITTCNGILLVFNESKRKESRFFLRDGKKWLKPNGLDVRNLDWCDYKNGILLPGSLTGEPIAYALSAEGLVHINGKPVTRIPWLGKDAILGLFTYDEGIQIFDVLSGRYYSLPKNYQPIYCLDLNAIFIREKTGSRRYAIFDIQHNKTLFLKDDSQISAVDGFYYIFEKKGETYVYNSKGQCFKWLGLPSIKAIRCPPYEVLVVESNTLKEFINTTTNTRCSFDAEDELSIYDTFLKVREVNGTVYLIDLLTGEHIPHL